MYGRIQINVPPNFMVIISILSLLIFDVVIPFVRRSLKILLIAVNLSSLDMPSCREH